MSVQPYNKVVLSERVVLPCDKLNENLYKHIKSQLKKQVIGKGRKHSIVIKVHKIKKYDSGLIIPEDLQCKPTYNVSYSATICTPIQDTSITARISKINKAAIIAVNGPIDIWILQNAGRFDSKYFTYNKDILLKKKEKEFLQVGDYVNVKLLQIQCIENNTKILVLGYLQRIAKKSEIKSFEQSLKMIESDKFIDPSKVNKKIYADNVDNSNNYLETFAKDSEKEESDISEPEEDEKKVKKEKSKDNNSKTETEDKESKKTKSDDNNSKSKVEKEKKDNKRKKEKK